MRTTLPRWDVCSVSICQNWSLHNRAASSRPFTFFSHPSARTQPTPPQIYTRPSARPTGPCSSFPCLSFYRWSEGSS